MIIKVISDNSRPTQRFPKTPNQSSVVNAVRSWGQSLKNRGNSLQNAKTERVRFQVLPGLLLGSKRLAASREKCICLREECVLKWCIGMQDRPRPRQGRQARATQTDSSKAKQRRIRKTRIKKVVVAARRGRVEVKVVVWPASRPQEKDE